MADAPALGAIPALLYASRTPRDASASELYAPRTHRNNAERSPWTQPEHPSVAFRLLGPLEVDEVGGRIPIDRGKPLGLLGLLLLHANQVVPIENILEALWGDELPDSAEHAVEVYVSRLRRVLGPERIETHPPGYRLRVEDDELDLRRFVQLVSEANEASASGDPKRAGVLLEDAERLWRGPPLPELDPIGSRQASSLQLGSKS